MDVAWKTARINDSRMLEGEKEDQKRWNKSIQTIQGSKILKTREGGVLRISRQDKVDKDGNACE